MEEKHFEELNEAKRELDELKRQLAGELPSKNKKWKIFKVDKI